MPPKALDLYTSDIPRGYVKGTAPDGSGLVIPQYFIPDLHQSFAALREKVAIDVANAKPLYHNYEGIETESVGCGLINFPPDPLLSDRERLDAHAEVISLQEQLGISYKDASHRLYMAELGKLKVMDTQCKAWANLAENIKTSLQSLNIDPTVNTSTAEDEKKA